MEFAWLEDFTALSRSGNFSRAAASRNVTQPAFSRRIRALESWLAVELVDRSTHQIALTPAGKRFAVIAEAVLRDIEHGRREVQEIAGSSASTIKFFVTHALALTFFPHWLAIIQSRSETPMLIQMTADNMGAAEQMMLDGKAHFCLCHHHEAAPSALDGPGFKYLTLGTDTLVPVSAPCENSGEPIHALAESGEHHVSLLAYGATSGMGRIVSEKIAKSPVATTYNPVFASHTMVLARMVKEGTGMAWLPDSIVSDDLAAGRLVRAGEAHWDIPVDLRLYRARARQSASAEAFWALVERS